jgi:hypothetical protein
MAITVYSSRVTHTTKKKKRKSYCIPITITIEAIQKQKRHEKIPQRIIFSSKRDLQLFRRFRG